MYEHHHENMKKLEAGLPYLLKHNREHVKDMEKWIERAEQAERYEVAVDLRKICELPQDIARYLEAALQKLHK